MSMFMVSSGVDTHISTQFPCRYAPAIVGHTARYASRDGE